MTPRARARLLVAVAALQVGMCVLVAVSGNYPAAAMWLVAAFGWLWLARLQAREGRR